MKQGTLFSFFTKKPSPSPKDDARSNKRKITSTDCETTPARKKSSTVTPPSSASNASTASVCTPISVVPQQQQIELWEQVKIGMRIAVYWKDDDTYYNAEVISQKTRKKSEFSLRYDDGEKESLDLSQETFKLLDTEKKTNSSKKGNRRRIEEEDSDEEMEFEDEESETDGDEAYEDRPDQADEDDEEEDDWLVSDDEDEIQTSKKAKKKKSTTKMPVKVTHLKKKVEVKTPAPCKLEEKIPNSVSPGQSKTNVSSPTNALPRPAAAETAPGVPLPYVDGQVNIAGSHVHNHLKFLRNPKDSLTRTKDHPDYDCRTLKVDFNELKRHQNLSPAVEQWWKIKAQYFDTVLLFKTGKFYEMFHMDADIGVQLLDFIYMKGKVAHSGFPEVSYGVFSNRLVEAGYKVARVEQTETSEQFAIRKKNTKGPKPKAFNREVCSVLTLGTRTFCYLDDKNAIATSDTDSLPLLAIREISLSVETSKETVDDAVQPVCEYGITVIDAARAIITVGQFEDDVLRSQMNTLLTSFEPSEILVEGGETGASETLLSLLRSYQNSSRHAVTIEKIGATAVFPKSNALSSDIRRKMERKTTHIKPWDVEDTIEELHRKNYFPRGSRKDDCVNNTTRWPPVLHAAVEGGAKLALSSMGAALFYLQRNLIDQEILSMGSVSAYVPPIAAEMSNASTPNIMDNLSQDQDLEVVPPMTPVAPKRKDGHFEFETTENSNEEAHIKNMALDGTTLQNLEVLTNSQTHTVAGSLWSKINQTKTPHGSRLLRAWLLRPLFRKSDIERRADAVDELVSGGAAVALSEARQVLAKCGDIERLLSRIHSMSGSSNPSERDIHPSDRAVLYESKTHTKRKVGDFSKLLHGLRNSSRIPELFDGVDIKSGLIRKIVRPISKSGCFPQMEEELDWFFDNFDCDLAAKGLFELSRGTDEVYDEACDTIERIQNDLNEYKDEMCSNVLRGSSRNYWKYINTKPDSKDKYLIELPASTRVPDGFIVTGKRGKGNKQVNKYRTAEIEEMVQQLEAALDAKDDGKARGMQLIFAKFDSKRSLWAAAAQTTGMLDALGALAEVSSKPGMVRPTILPFKSNEEPCIHVVQGRHPCVEITHNGGQFIPNDLTLGSYDQEETRQQASKRVLLLSGPNMGGKSTLLRQTCLIAILSQVGCFVPAEECALTPIDRIFTRLGATDRILLGQSTFFVELAETASALRGATRRSLVIMDELGRGTSTFDGTAIASACVEYLVQHNQCLTLFATHYHSLLSEWQDEPTVRLGHMECYVENEVDESSEENSEQTKDNSHNITFLYSLGDGPCPKSFGINVAKLAGLPDEVLSTAKSRSTDFEKELEVSAIGGQESEDLSKRILSLIEENNHDEIVSLWESLTN